MKKQVDYMGWADYSTEHDVKEKVALGAVRYGQKYDRRPTHCHVNAGIPGLPMIVAGVKVEAGKAVLRDHFYFFCDDEQPCAEERDTQETEVGDDQTLL
jgi:hypothetical protein